MALRNFSTTVSFKVDDDANNLANEKGFQEIKNQLLSTLLSHRMIHQERRLSNTKLSSLGAKITSGPFSRKVE